MIENRILDLIRDLFSLAPREEDTHCQNNVPKNFVVDFILVIHILLLSSRPFAFLVY